MLFLALYAVKMHAYILFCLHLFSCPATYYWDSTGPNCSKINFFFLNNIIKRFMILKTPNCCIFLSFEKFDWRQLWCVHFQVPRLQWSDVSERKLRVKLLYFLFCIGISQIFIIHKKRCLTNYYWTGTVCGMNKNTFHFI